MFKIYEYEYGEWSYLYHDGNTLIDATREAQRLQASGDYPDMLYIMADDAGEEASAVIAVILCGIVYTPEGDDDDTQETPAAKP